MPTTSAGPRSRTGTARVGDALTVRPAVRSITPGWRAVSVSTVGMAAATPWRIQGRKVRLAAGAGSRAVGMAPRLRGSGGDLGGRDELAAGASPGSRGQERGAFA